MLENETRIDDTPVHKAVREGFVNLIIHSDYMMDAGVLKIIKNEKGFEFTNPGVLMLPKDEIYLGGNSKARNPKMQTMLRMVGFGDNAGSGFPAILETWKNNGWVTPELVENTVLNQVTLSLIFLKPAIKTGDKKPAIKTGDKKMAIKTEYHFEKIRDFLSMQDVASASEIADVIGLKISRTKEILSMIDDIEAIGSNKNRKYKLKNKNKFE
jgi:predicted HTH transcriptional regulator